MLQYPELSRRQTLGALASAAAAWSWRRLDRNATCSFDDAVVLGGNVPMDVLALNIDDYIARTKAA